MKRDIRVEAALCPTDERTGKPIAGMEQPGYYPGYSTLSQKAFWDEATRAVVEKRVYDTPPIRFFSEEEAKFWTVVFDHLIPQTDRVPGKRIQIINAVDHRLDTNQIVGYRFEDMPEDREAYRLGLEAIDAEAHAQFATDFVGLSHRDQETVLKAIHDGKPQAAAEIWRRMSVHRFWAFLIQDAIDAYYSHPWSWDEIGFGGPAYPRAYMRLERGDPEPWEVNEKRYRWRAPAASLSDEVQNAHEFHTEGEQHRSHQRGSGSHPSNAWQDGNTGPQRLDRKRK